MYASIKIAALAAAFAMIATPTVDASAQSRKPAYKGYAGYKPLHPLPNGYWQCANCYPGGWRYRDTARGWDNTCVNVPWLPSAFACSAK